MVDHTIAVGYKKSEIGVIPEDWEVIPISKTGQYINGMAFKPSDWKKYGIPIVRIENLNDLNADFNYFQGEVVEKYLLKNEDILLSWSASLGVYVWTRGIAVLNQHIFRVIPKKNVNKEYLFWTLQKSIDNLNKLTHGSTMKHFQKGELERTLIALPSISEQKRISKILTDTDALIESLDTLITKKKNIKQGLMQRLLTRGIGHTKFKKTEIGEIPEMWEIKSLREIIKIRKHNKESRNVVNVIPMELILENGIYSRYRISREKEVIPPTYCEPGDVLIPKITPSVENGKQGIVPHIPSGYAFSTSEVFPLIAGPSVVNLYIFYLLKRDLFRDKLVKSMIGTTGRQRIPRDSLLDLKLPVPTIVEQKRISQILADADMEIESLEQKRDKYKMLKTGMMQQLLTGRIRVK